MRVSREIRQRRQKGVVLLLALVALLLISAVGAALLFMSSAESALVANQRSFTRSYMAGYGGLEEGRARMRLSDPTFIGDSTDFELKFPEQPGHVLYILNPAGTETVAPWDTTNDYYDWQYVEEFGVGIETLAQCSSDPTTSPPAGDCYWSVDSNLVSGQPLASAPTLHYKWVRFTVLTERAANRDIDPTLDDPDDGSALEDNTPVYWDFNTKRMTYAVDSNGDRIGWPVYRLTGYAELPFTDASRVVQYDVSSSAIDIDMPAAISLVGEGASCGATVGVISETEAGVDFDGDGTLEDDVFRSRDPFLYPSDSMDGDNCTDCEGTDWTKKYARSGTASTDGNDEAGISGEGGPAVGYTDLATFWDCRCEIRGSQGPPGSIPDECYTDAGDLAYQGSNTNNQYDGTGCTSAPCLDDVSPQLTQFNETQEYIDLINQVKQQAQAEGRVFSAAESPPQTDSDYTNDLVDTSGIADWGGPCDPNASPPDMSGAKTTVLDGDAVLDSSHSGCGTLLVTGDLTTIGAWEWTGVVLVVGEGSLGMMGGGDAVIRGALMMSRIYCDGGSHGNYPDPSDHTETDALGNENEAGPCPCTGSITDPPECHDTLPGTLEEPMGSSFRASGGGDKDIFYNSIAINYALRDVSYRVLAYRELARYE